jgi:hypothetical protein
VPVPAPPPPPAEEEVPMWGCGLLGSIPGINDKGEANSETQRLIDGIKTSSLHNKVNYWNWNLVPDPGMQQYLTEEFEFMPEMWGAGAVKVHKMAWAGEVDYHVNDQGVTSKSTMSHLFMGSNEPDIYGSCMGDSFGSCLKPDCCWGEGVHATGVGFWAFDGCSKEQPLPTMWEEQNCIDSVMGYWQMTAAAARFKGYKYLTTPLVAFNISYVEKFIEHACQVCHDISCGCPQYIGFHFYAYDCQPVKLGGYDGFKARLEETKEVMEKYPFIKGAIVNVVGMLNCQSSYDNPICVPDNGDYPASNQPDGDCPVNADLPNGMASYMDGLFDLFVDMTTSDGREVVAAFSWFMLDKVGGTYNQQIFDRSNNLNALGEAYIKNCQRWETSWKGRRKLV